LFLLIRRLGKNLRRSYTKNPINANPMNAKLHFEKTNKCKNVMLFGKKKSESFSKCTKK
jgi:hypothetical protein